MLVSLQRILVAGQFILTAFVTGCVVFVPPTEYPEGMDRELVQVGATSKEDVQEVFGESSEREILDKETMSVESWSYVFEDIPSNPIRFFPLLGATGFVFQDFSEEHSFALSFSPKGTVQGITSGFLRAYGYSSIELGRSEMVLPYGSKNLNAVTVFQP